jgi:hypothetical protein
MGKAESYSCDKAVEIEGQKIGSIKPPSTGQAKVQIPDCAFSLLALVNRPFVECKQVILLFGCLLKQILRLLCSILKPWEESVGQCILEDFLSRIGIAPD